MFIFIAIQSPDDISNNINISIQPSAQTYETGQNCNFDLNFNPTNYQD